MQERKTLENKGFFLVVIKLNGKQEAEESKVCIDEFEGTHGRSESKEDECVLPRGLLWHVFQ